MNDTQRNSPRRSGTTETASFHHDWEDAEPLSVAIVSTVATLSKSDPTELETVYDRVDPDALDAIFEPGTEAERDDGRLRFSLSGCEVTVYGDGFVVVRRLE